MSIPKKRWFTLITIAFILSMSLSLDFGVEAAISELRITPVSSFPGQMCASTFNANGTLFAGDNNSKLYRSDDNAATFRLIYQFPTQPNIKSVIAGYVVMIFVDSRSILFVSVPGTNRLYRSTDWGASFKEVLLTNGSQNDGFFIAMAEDSQGSLYAATYSNSVSPQSPPLLKSTDGGATWTIIRRFAAIHIHNVKFNPSNGYLYVATGEWAGGYNSLECERVFRSKDFGQTWGVVVNRPQEIQGQGSTVYLSMLFNGSYVYLGSDQAYKYNWIDRFYDDGSASNFSVQRVYNFPADSYMPVASAVWLGSTALFSSTAEFYNGTSRIVASDDLVNWQIIKATNVTQSQHHTDTLTSNPTTAAFFSDGIGQTYTVQTPPPPPPPTPTPVPTDTPFPEGIYQPPVADQPFPTQSEQRSTNNPPAPTPTKTPNPTQKPTATPTPTPTNTTHNIAPELPSQTVQLTLAIALSLVTSAAVIAKKKLKKRR